MPDQGSRLSRVMMVTCCVLLAAVSLSLYLVFPRSVVDDAFIYLRYSQNLATHGQLTWNVGADPVEGYTGILLPLLYALLFSMGLDALKWVPLLGILCYAGTGFSLLSAGRKHAFPLPVIITLIFSFTPFLYRHIFSGMETILYTFLLTLGTVLFFSIPPGKGSWPFSIVLFLLALSRPEGVVFAFFFAAGRSLLHWKKEGKYPAAILLPILVSFILPYAAFFTWRWIHYGYPFPNPYYVKSAGTWMPGSVNAMISFLLSPSTLTTLALLALGGVLWWIGRILHPGANRNQGCNRGIFFAAVMTPIAIVLILYSRTDLIMNFSHRFFVPLFPLLLLLSAESLDPGLRSLPSGGRMKGAIAAALLAGCLLAIGVPFPRAALAEYRTAQVSWALLKAENIAAGQKLGRVIPPQEVVVTVIDSGAIPYYSRLPNIDLGGLNDEFIAHSHPSPLMICDHVFQANPGVFVFTSYSPTRVDRALGGGSQALIDALQHDPRFDRYHLAEVFTPPEPDLPYYQFVYVREDLVAGYGGW